MVLKHLSLMPPPEPRHALGDLPNGIPNHPSGQAALYGSQVARQRPRGRAGAQAQEERERLLRQALLRLTLRKGPAERPGRTPGLELVAANLVGRHLEPLEPGVLGAGVLLVERVLVLEGVLLVGPVLPWSFVAGILSVTLIWMKMTCK